jgi:hypothetical protein
MRVHPIDLGRATTLPLPDAPHHPCFDHARNRADLHDFFAAPDAVAAGLPEITFGEFLVGQGLVDRFELLRALQLQDHLPGVPIGACIAALGFAPLPVVEQLHQAFAAVPTVTLT